MHFDTRSDFHISPPFHTVLSITFQSANAGHEPDFCSQEGKGPSPNEVASKGTCMRFSFSVLPLLATEEALACNYRRL